MAPHRFNCIIVDDEPDAIELLSSRLNKVYDDINIVNTFSSWQHALNALREIRFDILFMDISMPGKTGINLLKLVSDVDFEIIFVTAHDNYALDAFNLSATGYILKPVDDAELKSAVDKARERILNKKQAQAVLSVANGALQKPEKITIPHPNGFDYINPKSIIYLETIFKGTRIVTEDGEINSSHPLNTFQFLIDGYSFFQTHRSFMVNLDHILRYEASGLIVMKNKAEIPLSRSFKAEFLNIYM